MNTPTLYRQELKNRILLTAMSEFKRKGIRAVKMDDIANLLSISKRTLYEIYANKEELLLEGILKQEQISEQRIEAFASMPQHTVMDVLVEFYHMQMENLTGVNVLFFSDLCRYERVTTFLANRREVKRKNSLQFFKDGIAQGYFQKDMDYELIARVSHQSINYIFETQLYNEYELPYIFRNIILLYIRGCCTLKGLEIIDRLMK